MNTPRRNETGRFETSLPLLYPDKSGLMKKYSLAFLCLLFCFLSVQAQDINSFEKRITVKKLANGLTIIVMERPEAPVFSFYTYVNAGSAQEVNGITGLAHMFEHMAFKGTDKIGTTNYRAEKLALDKVEKIYAAYLEERLRETGRDPKKIAQLEKEWQEAVKEADQYVVPEEYSEIIESQGGAGLNASTSWDNTDYFCSFPENRLELWASLESERFRLPCMHAVSKHHTMVYQDPQ